MFNSWIEIDWICTGKTFSIHPIHDKRTKLSCFIWKILLKCVTGYWSLSIERSNHRARRSGHPIATTGFLTNDTVQTKSQSISIWASIGWWNFPTGLSIQYIINLLIFSMIKDLNSKMKILFCFYSFSLQHWLHYVLNYHHQPVSEVHLCPSMQWSMFSIALNYLIVSNPNYCSKSTENCTISPEKRNPYMLLIILTLHFQHHQHQMAPKMAVTFDCSI